MLAETNSGAWPNWYPGNEFPAIRDKEAVTFAFAPPILGNLVLLSAKRHPSRWTTSKGLISFRFLRRKPWQAPFKVSGK